MAVGVGGGMPVAAVTGRGDAAQKQLLPGRRPLGQAECIVCMAHNGTSFASILLLILLYCLFPKKQWAVL